MKTPIEAYSDIDLEEDVCRFLLQDFPTIAGRFHELEADHLTQDHTRAVHAVVKLMHAAGEPVDQTVVILRAGDILGEDRKPLLIGLVTEYNKQVTAMAFSEYVRRLRNHWKRRTLKNATNDISVADPDEAVAKIREALDAVADPPPPPPSMADALTAWADNLSDLAAGRKKPGIATSIPGLDEVTCGGPRPGELWIVGGQTSSGKTALEIQTCGNLLDAGRAVYVASLEMPVQQIIDRFVCNRGSVFLSKLKDPAAHPLNQLDTQSIARVIGRMKQWKIEIHDESSDITAILDAARAMKERTGLDVLVLDYLQIGTTCGDYGTREREVADISRTLKRFAIAEHVVVIALSQLNDHGEIRESRAIGHDADVVMKIVEDGVVIEKNRNGQSGIVLPLVLDGRRQTFVERKESAA